MSFLQLRSKLRNPLTSSTAAVAYTLAAAAGSIAWTGTAATLKPAYVLSAGSGSVAWTGTAATLNKGYTVAATSGSYAWTGTAANFAVTMPADPGSYTWTGTNATLLYTSLTPQLAVHTFQRNYPRAFAPAVFGKRRFEFVKAYNVQADPGSVIVTGTDANFATTQVGQNINQRPRGQRFGPRPFAPNPFGHLTTVRSRNLASYAANSYALAASPGSFAWTGTAATLLEGHVLPASSGLFDWSVFSVNLNRGRTLTADPGSFLLTAPGVNLPVTMPAAAGSYVVSGSATLIYSGAPVNRQNPPGSRNRWGQRVHYIYRQ